MFILFLPTRSPEWNPQELVWQYMCRKMQQYPLRTLRESNIQNSTAIVAHNSLKEVTHEHVVGFFIKHSEVLQR